MSRPSLFELENHADFIGRHIGPTPKQQTEMAQAIGYDSLDALIDDTVPGTIRRQPMQLPGARTEQEVIARLRELAKLNTVNRSFIGTGYHDTITRAYLRGIRLFLEEADVSRPVHELVNELLMSPMGRRDWPLRFWSKVRLMSVEARRGWVDPDLKAMP